MAVWLFTQAILAGEPIPVFNHGVMWRDFTYIESIVSGVLAVADALPVDDGTAPGTASTTSAKIGPSR
jgi:UDP-glucuronate 4-epimerase